MADQKKEELTPMGFWLNPSLREDGIYRLHINYADTSGRLKYNERPPYRLTLAEKMVYAPELITDDEKKSLAPEYPLTNPKNTKQLANGQTDRNLILMLNIKAAKRRIRDFLRVHGDWERRKDEADETIWESKRIKSRNTEYAYIGNSEPVAKGISAFFIKRSLDGHQDVPSLRDIMRMDRDYDIFEWYESYYQDQFYHIDRPNKTKTIDQGRLSQDVLIDQFNRDHLEAEEAYLKVSDEYFKLAKGEEAHTATLIRDYARGYMKWLSHKGIKVIRSLETGLEDAQLKQLYSQMQGHLKATLNDFLEIFSNKPLYGEKPTAEWIDLYRGKPNKTNLRAFLEFMQEPMDLDKHVGISRDTKFFVDKEGRTIMLNKRGDKDILRTRKDVFFKMVE